MLYLKTLNYIIENLKNQVNGLNIIFDITEFLRKNNYTIKYGNLNSVLIFLSNN